MSGGKGLRGHSWLWWAIAVVVVMFVYQNPQQAADLVRQGVDLLETAASRAVTFVSSVASGV